MTLTKCECECGCEKETEYEICVGCCHNKCRRITDES